ncbi:MAG TPA: cupredoxin domain-containing protein [Candidatus Dormibacteraeota bacterium]|jgi:plastocyanin|nr:cupredoxin domain-containing protein [Candidatus Dormibacteraeota bacterium]
MSRRHGCVPARAALVLAVALVLGACASPTPVRTDRVAVVEPANAPDRWGYSPELIEVAVGTAVVWHNGGTQFHTVTSDSPGRPFDLGLDPGRDATFTFGQAGTFAYHCGVHPQMKGTVIVR